ncbi:MAG: hypothetical protein ACYC8T_37760, partial [Myxococcaceae bacterium]
MLGLLLAGALFASGGAAGAVDDERTQGVREELDRDLNALVTIPAPRVEVVFRAIDEPNVALVEAEFTLDGKELDAPSVAELGKAGDHTLFSGQVGHGQHTLVSRLVYADKSSIVLSDQGGHRWKVGSDFSFPAQRGLEVRVLTVADVVASAKELKDRLKVSTTATPKIVARLEDGTMPPSPVARLDEARALGAAKEEAERKALEAQQAQQALSKAEEARLAKQQAKEIKRLARQAKAEEVKAARLQAAADKKARAEEARLARAEAAAAKKARAEEARAARQQLV